MGRSAARVPAGRFRAQALGLLARVERTREEIIVTRYVRPIAKLVPVEQTEQRFVGSLAGQIEIRGDIVEPIGVPWEAEA
ncbi:MAG: type II toxin-antitoxin system Phd/YefM family antitoxin [Longimicrobiales bacterium]